MILEAKLADPLIELENMSKKISSTAENTKSGKNIMANASATSLDIKWSELWRNFDRKGVLDERLLDLFWKNVLDQKPGLIGLMKKFDLICEKRVVGVKVFSFKYDLLFYQQNSILIIWKEPNEYARKLL